LEGVDAVVDALDNYLDRYALNKACLEKRIPFFHRAVHGFTGQAMTIIPGQTACLRCIIPKAPPRETFPILGTVAGTIGSIQTTEVIKHPVSLGSTLKNRLLIHDGLFMEFHVIEVNRNSACPDCGKPLNRSQSG